MFLLTMQLAIFAINLKKSQMLKVFKFTAILEGISYLVLFFNMLVIKNMHLVLYKNLLYPIGMAHGILFIGYILFAFLFKNKLNWNLKTFSIVLIASILPFGTFYAEKKYLENV